MNLFVFVAIIFVLDILPASAQTAICDPNVEDCSAYAPEQSNGFPEEVDQNRNPTRDEIKEILKRWTEADHELEKPGQIIIQGNMSR